MEVEMERVENFTDTKVPSNVATPLPRGHIDKDVEEFERRCITKHAPMTNSAVLLLLI